MRGTAVVGVRGLKASFSKHMGKVNTGQSVAVTESGKPIGKIVPEAPSAQARLQVLVEAGLAEWSGECLGTRCPVVVNRSEALVSDIVVEMRE